jgi:AP endonuclease-1
MDTCHVFAAGYDIRTPAAYAATMAEFDKVIGLQYLKALHINDSKAPLKSNRDLHARIGTGYIGLLGFWNIVNDDRLHGLPMTLETPIDTVVDGKKIEDKSIWAREIKMLEKLVGMDFESEEFKTLEKDLQEEGTGEREKIGDQVERKKAKDAKAGAPKVKKETTEKAPKVKKDAAEKAPRKSRSKKAVKEEIEEEDEEENE